MQKVNQTQTDIVLREKPNWKNWKVWTVIYRVALLVCLILIWYSIPIPSQTKRLSPSIELPITYIWLGSELPIKYKKFLSQITYPYKLLTEKQWQPYEKTYAKYNLTPIIRADILRLQHIYHHGGIYADFDTIIDYTCLMKLLPINGVFFGREEREDQDYLLNNFVYSSEPYASVLEEFINLAREALDQGIRDVFNVAGPETLKKKLHNAYILPNFKKCCRHLYDGYVNWKGESEKPRNKHDH